MVARVFHGFGSGVCESLPVQLVNDVFFLHERGKRLGYYTGMATISYICWMFTNLNSLLVPGLNFAIICRSDAGGRVLLETVFLRLYRLCSGALHCSLLLRGRDSLQASDPYRFHIAHR